MGLLKILIILKEYWLIDLFKALSGQSDLKGILKFILNQAVYLNNLKTKICIK